MGLSQLLIASSFSQNISEWVITVMERLGEVGVALLIAIENLFPPLPSEAVLPLAGFTASQGELNLMLAIVWATAGSLAGALVLYGVGRALGRERIRAIVERLPLMRVDDVDNTEVWFIKHETKAVFFGRMIPIFRSLISIPAGIERMKLSVFVVLTVLGSLIWNTAFISAGYALGENWETAQEYASLLQKLVLAGLAIGAVYFIIKRTRKL